MSKYLTVPGKPSLFKALVIKAELHTYQRRFLHKIITVRRKRERYSITDHYTIHYEQVYRRGNVGLPLIYDEDSLILIKK